MADRESIASILTFEKFNPFEIYTCNKYPVEPQGHLTIDYIGADDDNAVS